MRPGKLFKIADPSGRWFFYPIKKRLIEIIQDEREGKFFKPSVLYSDQIFMVLSTEPEANSVIKNYINFFDLRMPWLIFISSTSDENFNKGLVETSNTWFYDVTP